MKEETWEQTKARLKETLGIGAATEPVPVPPMPRYDKPIEEMPKVKLFNVHKRSLPVGIDKIVLFNAPRAEAEWWVEHKLKTKAYQDDIEESKTVIYYDIIPVDAKPKERSVFYNPAEVCIEAFPDFKRPHRIN